MSDGDRTSVGGFAPLLSAVGSMRGREAVALVALLAALTGAGGAVGAGLAMMFRGILK